MSPETQKDKGTAIEKWSEELQRRIESVKQHIESGVMNADDYKKAKDSLVRMNEDLNARLNKAKAQRSEFCKPEKMFGIF
jgi:hypothetical protein